jgi:hypothetical protein
VTIDQTNASRRNYFGGKKLRPSECVFSAAAPVKEVKCSSVKGIPLGAYSIPVRGIGAREDVYDFCGSRESRRARASQTMRSAPESNK